MTGDEIITVEEAAEILGITTSGVIKAIKRDVIQAKKFGAKNWAVFKSSVIQYRDNRGPGPGRSKSPDKK